MTHKHGGDVYTYKGAEDFSANINYRGMPDSVRTAAEMAVAQAVHYPDPECRALREALAMRENRLAGEWRNCFGAFCRAEELRPEMRSNFRYSFSPEQFFCGNGAAELMFALAAAYRPQRALLAAPSFFEYEQALTAFGCPITRFQLKEEDDFAVETTFVDAAALFVREEPSAKLSGTYICEEQLPGTAGANPLMQSEPARRMIILGNPNNPTGRLLEAGILERLIRLCRESRTLLVLDESFLDFLSEEDCKRTFSGVCRLEGNPYLFVIRSFTKIYAMPGLRFGYGVCSDSGLLSRMCALLQPWNVSVVAQAAAQAAAQEYDFARQTAKQIAGYRAGLSAQLEKCGCRVFPSAANFLLLRGPQDLQEQCLRRGFLIRDCDNFPGLARPGDGSGYFRVCVRSPEENAGLVQTIRNAILENK